MNFSPIGSRILLRGGLAVMAANAASLLGCGSSESIVLRPVVATPAAKYCPSDDRKYRLSAPEDKRGYGDAANVGFTQTGVWNVKASLRTQPPPAALLDKALRQTLARCGLISSSNEPYTELHVSLLRFQLTETTGAFSETMVAHISYEVEAVEPSTKQRTATFVVKREASDSGIDTTDSASGLTEQALNEATAVFLRELAKVPPPEIAVATPSPASEPLPAVADAPSTPGATVERAASDPTGEGASGRQTNGPISQNFTLVARPFDREDERNALLRDNLLYPLIVAVQRKGDTGRPVRFRRGDFVLTFADGSRRYPLDPEKVRERVGVNLAPSVAAFGLIGLAVVLNQTANQEAVAQASDEFTLKGAASSAQGVLFFDLEGLRDKRAQRLELLGGNVAISRP